MRQVVEEYEIKHVLHFTQATNLQSIFKYGLLPVSEHFQEGISAVTNDTLRLDFCHGATSVSLSYPNYKLFYRFRQETSADWAVLFIKPDILWEKECAYCFENAASANVANQTIQERKSEASFRRMFAEVPNKPQRSILGLHKSFTTNPQAEVLVFGEIQPAYIWGVAFANKFEHEKYKVHLPEGVQSEVVSWVFDGRKDYIHWQ